MNTGTKAETEVTHISSHGVWLLANGRELFLPYNDFPWFKDAPVGNITNVEEAAPGQFHWPDIDVDLNIKSIEQPGKYPLIAK